MKFWQVDSFTHQSFSGNPAAVCLLDSEIDAQRMQLIAAEMNVGATAFVKPSDAGFDVRWFSPTNELDLCGHGTLAAAHVIWHQRLCDATLPIRFHAKCGNLDCMKTGSRIRMDFPLIPMKSVATPPGLLDALGIDDGDVGLSSLDYVVVVNDAGSVRALTPNFSTLSKFPVRGIAVTSLSDDPKFDFISRFFAPANGINEDPVCGSAHCCLGPYWSDRLGKSSLIAYQASTRGGTLYLEILNDRVSLGGEAVTVMHGELYV